MVYNLNTYSEFCEAIQHDELVYLFGSGISTSLSCGKSLGWYQWIISGLDLFDDLSRLQMLREALDSDTSAANFVKIIGEVIRETKSNGKYDTWMKASFETYKSENIELADTLKKLLMTQDVFATTNYDLLLEQSTGLSTLTYEKAKEAFYMLDKHISDSVIHIHGVYDSEHDEDTIIADEEQYQKILNDKGAQFIQSILGTRTIILIGCGQTTDDVNIVRLLDFANTHLKMDLTYYILVKSGQAVDALPGNIKPIVYGDEYGDLTSFLEMMAQMRIGSRIDNNPLILRTAYTQSSMDTHNLAEYHFANQYLKYCGRATELSQIENFAEAEKQFSWWAVTGQAGSGKSRLAFEFIRRTEPNYFRFFLNISADIQSAAAFQPFNNTFVVCDYIKGNEARIAQLIMALTDVFKQTNYKLRILFLERDNTLLTGSWFDLLVGAFDSKHKAAFLESEYNTVIASRKHRFIYLNDLPDDAVLELIADICQKRGFPEDVYRDKTLKKEYAEKFEQLRFRPLFIQLYVETWINNGCVQVDYQHYEDLLFAVLQREQERMLRQVDDDKALFAAMMRIIIRACISDTLRVNEIPEYYRNDWQQIIIHNKANSLPGMQRKEQLQSFISDAAQQIIPSEDAITPMYPDIIKEALLIYYVDEDELEDIGAELWVNCPEAFSSFLSRAVIDFPDNKMLREYIRKASSDFKNTYAMETRFALLQNEVVHNAKEGPELEQIVEEEYEYWCSVPLDDSCDDEYKLIVLKGLNFSTEKYLGWSKIEVFDIFKQIASFYDSDLITPYKISYMLDYAHIFTEQGIGKSSETVLNEICPVIDRMPSGKNKTLIMLRVQRERIINLILAGKRDDAWEAFQSIYDEIDESDEQMVELYSYIAFSCTHKCFQLLDFPHLLNYYFKLQDLAEEYGAQESDIAFNDKIHYYYLHAKLLNAEAAAMGSALCEFGDFGIASIDSLINEIESNIMIPDFSGLLVGAWALKVGFDEDVSDEQALEYLRKTDLLLLQFPDNEVLAEKVVDLWQIIFSTQLKKRVPSETVRRAYAMLLRFPDNCAIIDTFFQLLKESHECGNWQEYSTNKTIKASLIRNRRIDYICPPEDEKKPFVRERRKVGANEPCPCGSKKKFKKCCRGNGRFD